MRLLVFSDLHGEETAVEKLKELAAKENFDYVLSCGDNSRAVSFLEDLINSFSNFYPCTNYLNPVIIIKKCLKRI